MPTSGTPGAGNFGSVGSLPAARKESDENEPSAACSPNEAIVAQAERYRALNHRPPGYGRSWRQVLLFLGVDHEYNDTDPVEPVTLAEMDARVRRWGGWLQFRDEVSRLLDCGWTPGVQVTAQRETQRPETQQPKQEQPEPQQASAPTSYEAWVTQTPDQDYAARFTYYVPEGMYKRYDVTLHVQLTPADASIDGGSLLRPEFCDDSANGECSRSGRRDH